MSTNRHQPNCPMGTGGDVCACTYETPECLGCIEKEKRLRKAVSLLRRGIKMLNRAGWEKGETDEEWKLKAQSYVNAWDMEEDYLRSLTKPGRGIGTHAPKVKT